MASCKNLQNNKGASSYLKNKKGNTQFVSTFKGGLHPHTQNKGASETTSEGATEEKKPNFLQRLFGAGSLSTKIPANMPHTADSRTAVVTFSKENRCSAGTITFILNGKKESCPVLGRGVTRWKDAAYAQMMGTPQWDSIPNREKVEDDKFGKVYTKQEDWQEGKTSDNRTCFYLKEHRKMGATPTGSYNLSMMVGKPSEYGSIERVELAPKGFKQPKAEWKQYKSHEVRGTLRVHSDPDFRTNPTLNIEYPTISSAGCLKLNLDCQAKFNNFVKSGGQKLVVREN